MTAVDGHDYEHVAVLHDGPDDLARRVAEPLRHALERGESVLVCLDAPTWQAVAARTGPVAARATVMPGAERYATPGTAMAELHRFVDGSLDAGAPSVWSIGALPFEGDEHDDRWWRYESAVDAVLGDRPLHAICSYDRATATPEQVAGACRTHAVVDGGTGRHASPSFRLDADVEAGRPSPPGSPQLDLRPDTVAEARHSAAAVVGASLDPGARDDLMVMVSEMVANGLRHGRPPVNFRLWDAPDEVVVEVRDGGEGLDDVYADLRRPRGGAGGGYGLWLVGQLADRVTIGCDADRTVVTAAVRR